MVRRIIFLAVSDAKLDKHVFETHWYMKVTSSKAPPQTKAIFRAIVSECPDLGLEASLIATSKRRVKMDGSGYFESKIVQANMPRYD